VSSQSPDQPASADRPKEPNLNARLIRLIEADGAISLARFMAEANEHYYATRDPFGGQGDFITAPEISQMFGELIGLALTDVWQQAGRPTNPAYVELGPGRGTLAADALRVMAMAGLVPSVHLLETSPLLRQRQRECLPQAQWHATLDTLPSDQPLLIIANEFFDALPVRQLVNTVMGWRELMVGLGPEGFMTIPGERSVAEQVPDHLRDAPGGSVYEFSPLARLLARQLAERLAKQGGAMLLIDYGYYDHPGGDTLQAVHAHAYADPLARPGESDLTAHVDFLALSAAAEAGGAVVQGPAYQGEWLIACGIDTRADQLSQANPERAAELMAAHARLTRPEQMGTLFRVMALRHRDWPQLPGFARLAGDN
jgi:NADH dehydrogenase [ubiquinone] 1 alpha subcomplex assembly factor 7